MLMQQIPQKKKRSCDKCLLLFRSALKEKVGIREITVSSLPEHRMLIERTKEIQKTLWTSYIQRSLLTSCIQRKLKK